MTAAASSAVKLKLPGSLSISNAVNDFFEHLGPIAGLVLVSVLCLHEQGK